VKTVLSFFVLATAGFPFLCSSAADALPEVLISAALRDTTLSRLPASATVLGSDVLNAAGSSHFGDVLGAVPNLNAAGGTSRPRYFQLRGIGEVEQYEGAPNSSVGFVIDDIDFSGIGMPAALYDAARVEVLRGPQGTAAGANALAGLISLTTQAPQDRTLLRADAELGDYGLRSGGLVFNDTLADGAGAYRLVAHAYRSDGYRRNAYLGRNDTNGFDENLLRGKLRWQLASDLRADVTLLFADINNGYDAWSNDNTRITQSDRPGRDAQRSLAGALRLTYEGYDGYTLRSISSYADSQIRYSFDADWGNEAYWGIYAPYDFYERTLRERRTASQELRAVSSNSSGPRWVAGVYALRLTESNDLHDLYNGDIYRSLVSDYAATNVAAYAQVDIDLTSRWLLSTGLRLERHAVRYNDSNALRFSPADNLWGGHISLSYQLAEGKSAYATLTRGYKAGGFNLGTSLPEARSRFGPESLYNLETGFKVRSADGRFDAQTSVFYMRREQQQVASSYQSDPADPLTFVFITDNAARGENLGVEASVGWQPVTTLHLTASLGLLRARFLDYTPAGVSLAGRDQAQAPQYQFSVAADYHFAVGFFAHADLAGKDRYYFSPTTDQRSTAYQLLNLRMGYDGGAWTASVWARNALNRSYATRGFFFGNEPPDYTPKSYLNQGDPRQLGASVSITF